MSKVAFSKLALKRKDEINTITINNNQIEVKQYLPINEKLELISRVLNQSHDTNNFANPLKVNVFTALEMIYAYTNLNFTEKQKEDPAKLFDILDSNGVIDIILDAIPEEEYMFLVDGIDETVEAFYSYQNSILGILDTINTDYSNLKFDITDLQTKISDPDNLQLLKDVLVKLG